MREKKLEKSKMEAAAAAAESKSPAVPWDLYRGNTKKNIAQQASRVNYRRLLCVKARD
jgi:hypothetical protein